MKNTNNDESHSSNPLAIYLKKLAKKNKTNLSLMESQNIEANKIGFSNWHYFLKHLKNKFKNLKEHPFNPDNENKGLNPILKPYIFNLGFNLDYGTQFYANKSQLRNRFTSLHSKNFNQKYILHSIEEFKKLEDNYSLLFCQNKIGDIIYNFDIYIDENYSSHYLKIPFTNNIISHLFHKLSDIEKNYINTILFKHQYKNQYIDLDDLIDFFSHLENIYLNINNETFENFIKNTLSILIDLKKLSFFDKSKPEFILNYLTLSYKNIISITPISNFNIFELFLQYIVIDQLSVPIDSSFQNNKQYNIGLITYNINIFSSYFVLYSQLRAISCLSLFFFDLDNFLENKYSLEIIIANTTHFILPSYDLSFTTNFLEFINYETSDLKYYPQEWILNPNNFIITSSSNNYYINFTKNINLCSINNK